MGMHVKWEWTVPNGLSLFRIVLIPVFVLFYYRSADDPRWLYGALAALLLSALSDFFDGRIARRFHQISEIGKLLDPVADKLTQIAVILCVALRHPDLIWLLVICVVKELLQTIGGYLQFSRISKVEGSHWYGKVATFLFYLTMALVVANDYGLLGNNGVMELVIAVMLIALIVFMLLAFIGYLRLFFRLKDMPREAAESGQNETQPIAAAPEKEEQSENQPGEE